MGQAPPPTQPVGPSRINLAYFAAGMLVVAAGVLLYQVLGSAAPGLRVTTPPRPTPVPVAVQVSGEVTRPGVVNVPATARVQDAIDAAGGPTQDGDPLQLNLAARVTDGQRIVVPRAGAASSAASTSDTAASPASTHTPARGKLTEDSGQRVNLNTATLQELESLPGIGVTTAQKIMDYRQQTPFTSVQQLLDAKLVNASTFARIQDLVGVD